LTLAANFDKKEPDMSFWISDFDFAEQAPISVPIKTRRGVTVITEYGRTWTCGVSQARTKELLKTMAIGRNHELMAAMQAHKASRLGKRN
jgi:hypothetical protein